MLARIGMHAWQYMDAQVNINLGKLKGIQGLHKRKGGKIGTQTCFEISPYGHIVTCLVSLSCLFYNPYISIPCLLVSCQ